MDIYFIEKQMTDSLVDNISDHNLSDCLALSFLPHSCPHPSCYLYAPDQVGGSRSRSVMWWTMLVSIVQDGEGVVLRALEAPLPTVLPSY